MTNHMINHHFFHIFRFHNKRSLKNAAPGQAEALRKAEAKAARLRCGERGEC